MQIVSTKIFSESFQHVKKHLMEWIRVAYAPIFTILIGLILMLYLQSLAGVSSSGEIPTGGMGYFVLGSVIYFITNLIGTYSLQINAFRYGVLNEGSNSIWKLQLNWRLIKLFLFTLLFGLMALVYMGVAAGVTIGSFYAVNNLAVAIFVGSLFLLYGFYLLLRLSLYPVAISVDKAQPFSTSWHLLKGNVFRLFLLILLIGVVMTALTLVGGGVILLGFALTFLSPIFLIPMMAIGIIFLMFMWFFTWAVYAKALSLVYRARMEKKA